MSLSERRQALLISGVGLVGLASAMGIGRFAFTPLLPLMQEANGLGLVAGSWLASINYLGYLLGALACIWLPARPAKWAQYGLLTVAITTLLMALPGQPFVLWLLWRLLAGLASAFVLVGTSAWCLDRLAVLNHSRFAGGIYAGVGLGVAIAGLVCLLAGVIALDPAWIWALLGLMAGGVWWWCKGYLVPIREHQDTTPAAVLPKAHFSRDQWRLIICYGLFGLGYILPATFLPAMAREQLPNPAVFGWVWPVFGAAAAASTLLVARFFSSVSSRHIWAVANVVMAIGTLLPVLSTGLPELLLASLCVGGTFMVMTMAGLQEARRVGGAVLIAAMTASFALGQIIGPLLLNLTGGALFGPSVLGATLLLVSAVWLLIRPPSI